MLQMTREEAREYIVSHPLNHLQRDKCGKGWICPKCGSGSGKHGTGITTEDGVHFTCWNGCFSHSDILDIIGIEKGLEDYNSKLLAACEEYGIAIAGSHSKGAAPEKATQSSVHNSTYTNTQQEKGKPEEPETDYTPFFLQAEKNIGKTDYHRGISPETLSKYHIGYVESWKHPKAPKMKPSPRLIIPTSRYSYLARYTGTDNYIDYTGKPQNKSKVGKVRIFNQRALREAKSPIFVVEGELDALSIIDVGGEAVGLGSLSNIGRIFLPILRKQKPVQPLILALDTDEAGQEREDKLAEELTALGVVFVRWDVEPFLGYKDANGALMADRDAFAKRIELTIWNTNGKIKQMEREAKEKELEEARKQEEAERERMEAEKETLQREAAVFSIDRFTKEIEESKTTPPISTGFSGLDEILEGGLYAGLYVVGAISSLGKTTFALQIADNIAKAGKKVLIFSLEMASTELIAKSVSRITFQKDRKKNNSTKNAKTTRGILSGARYSNYSDTEKELIRDAIAEYGKYAGNIWITEGVGDVSVKKIREKVEHFISVYHEAPVVLIDYLQIIAPYSDRLTDKQNTDKAVLELKRISRDYKLPVIGISSFNRENYTAPVNTASFKESGAIEYSSDVLIGLQYWGMDYKDGESENARTKRIRELISDNISWARQGIAQGIQAKILKNRNGSKGDVVLQFYPMFNCFDTPGEGGAGVWIPLDDNTGWEKLSS